MSRAVTDPRARVSAEALRAPRLGVFGGTFDPVHAGHLHAARAALSGRELDHVLFVPAARSPHKLGAPRAGADERLHMLRLALAGEPAFSASDLELARGAPSYTVDTLRELARLRAGVPGGELYLVLGSDNLPGLADWRDAEEVLALARPVVVPRTGAAPPASSLERLSPAARRRLAEGRLEVPPVDAEATDLRERLARDPAAAAPELSASVLEYLRGEPIYRRPR